MSNLAISTIPGWIDAWLFGITYVGPLTSFTRLTQATRQSVQVDTINGAFQVNFPSGMQINDVVEFVDIGNNVASAAVTLSSVVVGYPIQNPATGAIATGPGSYAFGSNETDGSRLSFQLVQDSTLGIYLKCLTLDVSGGSGGSVRTRSTTATTASHPTMARAAWQVQPLNSTGGAFTLPLPTAPQINDQIDFEDDGATSASTGLGQYAVTLNAGSNSIQDPQTMTVATSNIVLGTPNQGGGYALSIRFDGVNKWRIC